MKKITLTRDRFALVDDEDYERVSQIKWWLFGKPQNRYARGNVDGKETMMHRFILKPENHLEVDHLNGDGLDNRKENLRICTHAENLRNAKAQDSLAGVKGVHKNGRRWRAQITFNYKKIHLGYFDSKLEAHSAYSVAAKQLFGEYAKLA